MVDRDYRLCRPAVLLIVCGVLITNSLGQHLPRDSELLRYVFDEPCPKRIASMQNFDANAYQGLWYEMERYEQPFSISSDCVTAFYKLLADGTMSVLNQGLFLENGTKTAAEGVGVLTTANYLAHVGEMKVSFGNRPQPTTNYHILDTDYDRFAVVYNCVPLHSYRSAQSYWLLSRTRKQTKDLIVSSRIDEIKQRFAMDENRIRRTDQSDESCLQKNHKKRFNPVNYDANDFYEDSYEINNSSEDYDYR